jgi:hypothetical protein
MGPHTDVDYATLDEAMTNCMDFTADELTRIHSEQKSKPAGTRPHVLLILDDLLHDPEGAASRGAIESLFSKGRHLNLSAIYLSQADKRGCTKDMKNNADVILFGALAPDQAGRLHGFLNGTGMSKAKFKAWCQSSIVPHRICVAFSHANELALVELKLDRVPTAHSHQTSRGMSLLLCCDNAEFYLTAIVGRW